MARFEQIFENSPVLLPVIHVESLDQALRNAEIAHTAGCDGIFLINHSGPYSDLLAIHHTVFSEFPDWWIGVNCLDLAPSEVFGRINEEVAGVWVDNARINEQAENQEAAEMIAAARSKRGLTGSCGTLPGKSRQYNAAQ